MVVKICRRISPKTFAAFAILITVLLCVYYTSYTSNVTESVNQSRERKAEAVRALHPEKQERNTKERSSKHDSQTCPNLVSAEADINTVDVLKDFDFQPAWLKSKEYWGKSFEDRYERQKMDSERPPLKVIIVPHSHNDPGWLKTFEHYFHYKSRQILNHLVTKMQQYHNMTFIWSEVAFLNAWWEGAHPNKQKILKSLVNSGKLEITTGGWVMTDEADTHVYAIVDQLIEGHQWLLTNLGVKPKTGWSVDPFGHGSTVPYLLASSGLKGTVIQRIHYAWKQWFALKQYGDFKWIPNWLTTDHSATLLTHNQPFDIYSIKHSCGPHPYICLNFDFRKVAGEYTEYSIRAQAITEKNLKQKSELLVEQYARTGSLFPHNVVLMPLGDDFRYNYIEEWDQQYTNYMKLIEYINSNKDTYKTEIIFGTPKDYFEEIMKRYDQFPTLRGDFFVYSDIFSEGRPAYWSGYFTSRPFMKILDRELENSLRSAEILYSVAFNNARQRKLLPYLKVLEGDFEKLVQARRNLALFQHHDAITGTSKSFVMRDYGLKLFESIHNTEKIQQNAIQSLIFTGGAPLRPDKNTLSNVLERDSYEKLPKKTTITVEAGQTSQIVLFNSLAQPQDFLVQVRTTTTDIKVTNNLGNDIVYQINPVWNNTDGNTRVLISNEEYELIFIAKLPELSIVTYNITHINFGENTESLATVYCDECHRKAKSAANNDNSPKEEPEILNSKFKVKKTQLGDIQLENHKFKILFNGNTGFMKTVTRKHTQKIMQCAVHFGAYKSAQYHSGAYLFMPDPNQDDIEKDVLFQYNDQKNIIIVSGPVSSEVTVMYGPFLTHTLRIYHDEHSHLADAIYVESEVDFENPPKNRETELYMRILSDIQNGEPPELYTDLNGFQMQKRVKIERIGIEGNYYPITTMAYIQDDSMRLTLVTNHAQGAASWQPGVLEVMIDRRTLYDDSRGLGEGLVDNRKTVNKFWILLEDINHPVNNKDPQNLKRFENENSNPDDTAEKGDNTHNLNIPTATISKSENFSRPSLYANQMSNALNYPVGIYILENDYLKFKVNANVHLLNHELPCDVHLLTLRTQPDPVYSQFPSVNSLLVLHRQGYDCYVNLNFTCRKDYIRYDTHFEQATVNKIHVVSLTGIKSLSDPLNSLADFYLQPMSLQTYNVTFS